MLEGCTMQNKNPLFDNKKCFVTLTYLTQRCAFESHLPQPSAERKTEITGSEFQSQRGESTMPKNIYKMLR